ncbi:50S ribosomal protein L4 [Candidatus Persebacteraceae bacterium Df01]|jgi:large subunit ribosomal protein L4|uniref:Large ribosomal subunit protein uL4 n=1 Tax=Candidatus Doriopsillibacter californiensis TaxID=2970740 RepID=A0ABT7QLJ8_9GAMM|nr:50S ribosomal protein L4 [Candidatus Persebacteraceae bacterium Df01]
MELSVVNFGGGKAETFQVKESFLSRPYNAPLVHQVVGSHFANARQGTRAQKTRAEVHHSTHKLFRQKGSGRARGGMSSSPIRVGGGRAFPSRVDENFSQKVPRRMFRAVMAMAVSQLCREERLHVVKSMEMKTPKTKALIKVFEDMNIEGKVLLVDTEIDNNVELSARNLPFADVCPISCLLPSLMIGADKIVFTQRALQWAEEKWQ